MLSAEPSLGEGGGADTSLSSTPLQTLSPVKNSYEHLQDQALTPPSESQPCNATPAKSPSHGKKLDLAHSSSSVPLGLSRVISASPRRRFPDQANTPSSSPVSFNTKLAMSPSGRRLPAQAQTLSSPSLPPTVSPSKSPHDKLLSNSLAQTPSSLPFSHNLSPSKSFSCGKLLAKPQSFRSRSHTSQSVSPPKRHSRGMLLVQLAQQKTLTKSPTNWNDAVISKSAVTSSTSGRVEKPSEIKRSARRKLHLESDRGQGGGMS